MSCPYRDRGRDFVKCACPIWVDGTIDGTRVPRHSLDTANWARALKKIAALESGESEGRRPMKLFDEARAAYLRFCETLEPSTQRKNRNALAQLGAFLRGRGISKVDEILVETIDEHGQNRLQEIAPITWSKELEILRAFFAFCLDREWVRLNVAKRVKAPRNIKPNDVEPYTQEEVVRILAACDSMGRGAYERLRARAMVLLLRTTALRISDVATLAKSRAQSGEILIRTMKTGQAVRLPLRAEVAEALARLPEPKGSPAAGSEFYFWNGVTSKRCVIGIAERTLAAVFRASGVPKAHAHRFRHTLATELLSIGASFEDVAAILGNSAAVVERHYGKWSRARQERLNSLLARLPGTSLARDVDSGPNLMQGQALSWCGEGDLNPHGIAPASTSS